MDDHIDAIETFTCDHRRTGSGHEDSTRRLRRGGDGRISQRMKPQVQVLRDGVGALEDGRTEADDDESRSRARELAEEGDLGIAKRKRAWVRHVRSSSPVSATGAT